jgi:hypothetical protein
MTESLEAVSETRGVFDRRQPSPGPEHELGTVVPVQFYDLIRRSAFLDGETRLVFAVLEDAVRTYLRLRDSRRRADRVEFAEVARWFEARTGAVPFSFEYVCEVIEINPASLRSQMRTLDAGVLPMKQLRSVGRRQRVRSIRYAKRRSSWDA